jgi:hypothetical protein
MRIFILLVMLIALAILVHQNNQHHTKLNPVSSRLLHPFDDRIRYKIAELDPRFGISQEELIKITQEATQIWSLATGKDFFVYDPNARLGLHLIYDNRQYETEQRKKHIEHIDREQQLWGQKKQNVNQQQQLIDTERNLINLKRKELDILVQRHNTMIAQINQSGGAMPEQKRILELQNLELEQRIAQMETEIEQHNFNTKRLNQQVDELNQINHKINRVIQDFNQSFQPRMFDKGLFNGKDIYIYEFESIDDLRLTLAHEFGHALGLKHHNEPTALMFPMLKDQNMQHFRLQPADLDLLHQRHH